MNRIADSEPGRDIAASSPEGAAAPSIYGSNGANGGGCDHHVRGTRGPAGEPYSRFGVFSPLISLRSVVDRRLRRCQRVERERPPTLCQGNASPTQPVRAVYATATLRTRHRGCEAAVRDHPGTFVSEAGSMTEGIERGTVGRSPEPPDQRRPGSGRPAVMSTSPRQTPGTQRTGAGTTNCN